MSDDDEGPPVRGRKGAIFGESFDPNQDFVQSKAIPPKSTDEIQRIIKYLRGCFLFDLVSDDDLQKVINTMTKVDVLAGTVVVREGEPGHYYYVIERGSFQVSVEGKIVNTYVNNGGFGELALMYNTGRQATVIALTDGALWAMKRQNFKRLIVHSSFEKRKIYENFIGSLAMMVDVTPYDRAVVADSIKPRTFFPEEIVYKTGEQPLGLYFIEGGRLLEVAVLPDGSKKQIRAYTKGEHCGETEIMSGTTRRSTVYAIEKTQVAFISVDALNEALKPSLADDISNMDSASYGSSVSRSTR